MKFIPKILDDNGHYTLFIGLSKEEGYALKYGYKIQKTLRDKFSPPFIIDALRIIRRKINRQD